MFPFRRRITTNVKAGAAYLDVKDPGWDARIDTSKLNIASSDSCILGQLHGNFVRGLVKLELSEAEAREFGVLRDFGGPGYDRLTKDWVRLIDKRQLARSA